MNCSHWGRVVLVEVDGHGDTNICSLKWIPGLSKRGRAEVNLERTLVVRCGEWPITAAGIPPWVPAAVFSSNLVVSTTQAAAAEGVTLGQRRRVAEGLCPHLVVAEADRAEEARRFEVVLAALENVSADLQVGQPGVCAIPTRGPARYFGGEEGLVGEVGRVLKEVGIGQGWHGDWWGVGVADGAFAAMVAAEHSVVVPPGGTPSFLAPLGVATLGKADLGAVLARLGIETLGDFASLPGADVLARFGPQGALAHALASGAGDQVFGHRPESVELVSSSSIDPPADTVDRIAFAARSLAIETLGGLERRGLVATVIRVDMETEHGDGSGRTWRHDMSFSVPMVVERVRWQLEGWLGVIGHGLDGGVSLLRIGVLETSIHRVRQFGLWKGEGDAATRAARAVAKIQGLLGEDAVLGVLPAGGRGPGEHFALGRWDDVVELGGGELAPRPWVGAIPPPFPALVHPEEIAVSLRDHMGRPVVVEGRGQLSGDPCLITPDPPRQTSPSYLSGRVVAWAGPWPADERWWDPGDGRRRARLQILLEGGGAHLLVVEQGRWRVEASYD